MKAITANKGLSPDEQERRMKQAYSELDRQEEEITGRYQKQAMRFSLARTGFSSKPPAPARPGWYRKAAA
ncbi:MAG: hypothetical protein IPM23_26285 [Candidatus Melainabacteria bacterium]|nr:hypothetical protein [Candidatus Melainabacteria bacterium]